MIGEIESQDTDMVLPLKEARATAEAPNVVEQQHDLLIRRCAHLESENRKCKAEMADYELRFANALTALHATGVKL